MSDADRQEWKVSLGRCVSAQLLLPAVLTLMLSWQPGVAHLAVFESTPVWWWDLVTFQTPVSANWYPFHRCIIGCMRTARLSHFSTFVLLFVLLSVLLLNITNSRKTKLNVFAFCTGIRRWNIHQLWTTSNAANDYLFSSSLLAHKRRSAELIIIFSAGSTTSQSEKKCLHNTARPPTFLVSFWRLNSATSLRTTFLK